MPRTKRFLLGVMLLIMGAGPAWADELFDDLGGRPGIDRIVTEAMAIWSADPRVAPTFEDTNLVRFKGLLEDQLCSLSGGGCRYSGRSMAEAHKGLHLATVQFNALAEDLQSAMDKVGVSFRVQNRLMALLAPMHRDVVVR